MAEIDEKAMTKDDMITWTKSMQNADQGVVAELAGKVKLLERTQAGQAVTLANCEAAIELAASKELVTELSDRIASQRQAQTDTCAKLKEDITQVSPVNLCIRSHAHLCHCPTAERFICASTDQRPI